MPTSALHTPASSPPPEGAATDSASADVNSPDTVDAKDADAGSDETGSDADDPPHCGTEPTEDGGRSWRRVSPPRLALLIGLITALALAAVIGVLGLRAFHSRQSADLRALYLQVGRQGALNLTTIDWHHADADVQRILGAATGTFYDDFSQRSQPFIDVVKKVQSTSTGTVTGAGLESSTDTDAHLLVAVSVQTSTGEDSQQTPRAWRMRISVHKAGDDVKVSSVEFVP